MLNRGCPFHVLIFLKKVIVTTAVCNCIDAYYIAKKRLAFGRFSICGAV